jgi:beta-glucosidase
MWLARQGGWRNPSTASHFRRFTRHTVEQLGDLVKLWCTINEPSVHSALGYLLGEHAPGSRSLVAYFQVLRNLLVAHAAAYRVIHSLDGSAQVGLVKNLQTFEALDPYDRATVRLAKLIDRGFHELVLRAVDEGQMGFPLGLWPSTHGPLVDSIDFVGVNYYSRERVSLGAKGEGHLSMLQPTPGAEVSDLGRNGTYGEIYPSGMYHALKRASRLGKPIYITENGLPDKDDDQRPRFLLTHLTQVWRAIADGADVRGYYHWTLVDNFEWAEGWGLRFGLVALDEKTQARTPRPSATLYSQIAQTNAITREMVETYAPEVLDSIFS